MKTSLLAAAAALALDASAAQAGTANRVWVSGHGVDQAGCGAPTAPCRSLQYAHDNAVAAGGEIDILDPAGYGSVNITKAISIVNDGVGTAGVQATSGSAIAIFAGPTDAVFLKGLNVDGVHQSAGTGIYLATAGSLTVIDCVVRHFATNGIAVEPGSGDVHVLISNAIVSDNGASGIYSDPVGASGSITGVIEHVVAINNQTGIALSGGVSVPSTYAVNDTNASSNTQNGLIVSTFGNPDSVNVDSSYFNSNGVAGDTQAVGAGLVAGPGVTVRVSRSVLDANASYGVYNGTSPSAVYSAGDNHMDGNTQGKVSGPALLPDGFN